MLYDLLTTKNPNLLLTKWLLIFAILMTIILLHKHFKININNRENFTQRDKYVIKQNEDTFDLFYIELYLVLHEVERRVDRELTHIIRTTNPCIENSNILDVGSGTGNAVATLQEAGYNVYGIDKSENMCKYAKSMHKNIEVLNDDVLKPMSFEKNTFTHVLCTYFTIYNFEDKQQFFRNCYHWMKPGGYLVVHLVDKDRFERIIPNTDAISSRTHTKNNNEKLHTHGIFEDYDYVGSYELFNNSDHVTFKETFKDLETKHIRQNETDLYMESLDTICEYAKKNGFIYHAKTNMKDVNNDKNQYLYYFERPL